MFASPSVWPDGGMSSSPIVWQSCQNNSHSGCHLKNVGFQTGPNSCQLFWLLIQEFFSRDRTKIAQSGHTAPLLMPWTIFVAILGTVLNYFENDLLPFIGFL